MKQKENFFEKRKTTTAFAFIALAGGVLFLGRNVITGNAVSTRGTSGNLLSIIGLLLIACAVVLGAYSFSKK